MGITWKAAWLLKHKLMEVMVQRGAQKPLQGDVSVDDAYLGGERTGGGPGRGSSNKVAFVAAVEMRDGRLQGVRFDPVAGFSFAALTPRYCSQVERERRPEALRELRPAA